MRILQLIPYFYPAFAFGGPVQMAYTLSKELVKRGHEVVVYTTDAKNMTSRIDKKLAKIEGVETYYFRNISMMAVNRSKLFITPYLLTKIKKEIQSFDIIHCHEYRTFQNFVVHHYAKKHTVPYILQAHGSLPIFFHKQRLKLIYNVSIGNKLLRDASMLIALSQKEAKQYKCMGASEERIKVIPNGIDLSKYSSLPQKGVFRKNFGFNYNEQILLYVGRIHRSKGLDLLVKAFKIVTKNHENSRLVIIGPDDGFLPTLKKLISKFAIGDKVLITGFVTKKEKLAAFIDSDGFVTPVFHGFPLTFLEACSMECPIITTSNELEWINDNVGYVTQPSVVALAKKMSTVLENENIREKFKENCRRSIKNFDIDLVVDSFEKVYESLI